MFLVNTLFKLQKVIQKQVGNDFSFQSKHSTMYTVHAISQGLRPKDCVGDSNVEENCNTHPCDMQWSDWSECSDQCGRGNRKRITLCAEESGGNLTDCADLGLHNQAFEHVEECNTWDRDRCPRCARERERKRETEN